VLITHDRHVIRSVADAIVEVGHGKARWYDGSYEELQERRSDVPGTSAGAAPSRPADQRSGTRPGGVDGRGNGGKGGRRADAEQRNARYQATKDLRREVTGLEAGLATVEKEVADLTRQMADPDVYEDGDTIKRLVTRHGVAKDRAGELLTAWEDAQLRLDAAEAELEVS
jgi:ATP-binding cassette subfamily F protein 3